MSNRYRVWDDAAVVSGFQRLAIPYERQQMEVFLRLLPFGREQTIHLLDLGCGSGTLAKLLLDAYPAATAVAADFSRPMLELAHRRLEPFGARVQILPADFADPDWADALPGPFDAVVSRYAIHHLPDPGKRAVYQRCYTLLKRPGTFVNIEHVASASPFGDAMYERLFVDTLFDAAVERGEKPDYGEVQATFRNRPDRAANLLAPVELQLGWLRACGFKDVDCFWKCFELSILAGYKW